MRVSLFYWYGIIPMYRKLHFPKKLEEFSPRQFVEFVFFLNSKEHELPQHIDCVRRILGVSMRVFSKFDSEQIAVFLSYFNSFLLENKLDKFLIPTLTVHGIDLISCKPLLEDLCFGEFILADEMFIRYSNDKNLSHCNYIINGLYRDKNLSCKEHCADLSFFMNIINWSYISDEVKRAIAYNYGLVRKQIENMYPAIFEVKEEIGEIKGNINSGWKDILFSMTDDLTKIEKIEMQNVHYALSWLNNKIIEGRKNDK